MRQRTRDHARALALCVHPRVPRLPRVRTGARHGAAPAGAGLAGSGAPARRRWRDPPWRRPPDADAPASMPSHGARPTGGVWAGRRAMRERGLSRPAYDCPVRRIERPGHGTSPRRPLHLDVLAAAHYLREAGRSRCPRSRGSLEAGPQRTLRWQSPRPASRLDPARRDAAGAARQLGHAEAYIMTRDDTSGDGAAACAAGARGERRRSRSS